MPAIFLKIKMVFFSFAGLLLNTLAFSQVSIEGPTCVLTTLSYQYEVKGHWKEGDKISICVEGGRIEENGATCLEQTSGSSIHVRWSEGEKEVKIILNSQAGKTSINITVVSSFAPGFIGGSVKQTIGFGKVPPALICSPAAGGTCNPSFAYQWQESSDKLNWKDISGKAGPNLSFASPLKETTFFRRKVIDLGSKTEGYSNEVTVFVTTESKNEN